MIVRTKSQHQELYKAGRYGRQWPVWTLEEALASDVDLITVRSLVPQFPVKYDVPRLKLRWHVNHYERGGFPKSSLYFQPFDYKQEEKLILQGEYNGLDLTYSTAKKPMRQAFALGTSHAVGPHARLLLKGALDPDSYDDLLDLSDDFPGHVIEFSCWSLAPSWLQPRNTVIWEVRAY